MKKNIAVIFFLPLSICSFSQSPDYLGQALPGGSPMIFAPGKVSDGFANRDFAISPDGNEIFYTIQQRDLVSAIMYVRRSGGRWSVPEVAPFSGKYNDLEAAFAPDGKKIFFSSNRPINSLDSTADYNIWYIDRENDRWQEATPLGGKINSDNDEFYPSVAKSGNLYFTTVLDSGKGKEDIVMCEWKDGGYMPPVSLSAAINSAGYEFNAFVDPDEEFIIFTGYARADDLGRGDLYISIQKDGAWQPAVNLGETINSRTIDYCPFVTWDKKYLFYTSSRATYQAPFGKKQTFADLRKGLQGPGNGLDDIYWVRFDSILQQLNK